MVDEVIRNEIAVQLGTPDPKYWKVLNAGRNIVIDTGAVVLRIRPSRSTRVAKLEYQIADWLNDHGVTAAKPWAEQPLLVGNYTITAWESLGVHRRANPREMESALNKMHRLPLPPFEVPNFNAFAQAIALAQRTNLPFAASFSDRLCERIDELQQRFASSTLRRERALIHGDAWQGNCVVPANGPPTLIDFEKACLGPSHWDTSVFTLEEEWLGRRQISHSVNPHTVTTAGREHRGTSGLTELRSIVWLLETALIAKRNAHNKRELERRATAILARSPKPWTWNPIE